MSDKFIVKYRGSSKDLRTNVWEVLCPKCGKITQPPTTMFATQRVKCNKCGYEETINYNEILMILLLQLVAAYVGYVIFGSIMCGLLFLFPANIIYLMIILI